MSDFDWHYYDPASGEEVPAPGDELKAAGADMMRDVMKVATAMIVLPEEIASQVLNAGADLIPEEDLASKGREDEPHITIKYGVREDLDQTAEALVEFYPFDVTLGKTRVFPPSQNSGGGAVVYVEAIAPILESLHNKIGDSIGLRHDGADYVPHITLGYVNADSAEKYDGLGALEGLKFTASAITIKRKEGKPWTFDLGGAHLAAKAGEDDELDPEIEEIMRDILEGFEEIVPAVQNELEGTYLDQAQSMAVEMESSIQLSVLNKRALEYARARAAEMVGMKWVGGELVTNPNAIWAITDTTRDVLKGLIENAFTQGQTPAQLGVSIEQTGIFSAWRADLIASTEMARATRQGARDTAKEVGVVGKSSETSGDHTEENCDGSCDEAEDRGVIAIDEDYGVAGHFDGPGCNCVEVFYTADDPEAADIVEPEAAMDQ
jgi:2'-5' RNA ligase